MKKIFRLGSLIIVFALFLTGFMPPQAASSAIWQAKIDPWVTESVTQAADGETEFILFLAEQADLSEASYLKTKLEKGTYVYRRLKETAARTQGSVLAALAASGATYRPYWIANMIWVRGDIHLVQAMAQRGDISHIYANPKVRFFEPSVEAGPYSDRVASEIEWNIAKVRAPQAWAAGYRGQGVVVGGQDTGYQWDHPALKAQYRGWDGTTAVHDYNWHDAIHDNFFNPCGSDLTVPCDDNGHGTNTMGIIVGEDPSGANQIGMAPRARWIGCRNMDDGLGTPTTYSECFQWFLAPTDLKDQNPDPAKAPDVINNSWGCPPEEGCTDPSVLQAVVEAVQAAGIVNVQSAGNTGADCSTIQDPAAIYDASFTVGSTTQDDAVSDFSSRGPVTVDGSGRLKPDIAAPGFRVRTSIPGGGYAKRSGTSMAGPHVTGQVALILSAHPNLRGQVDWVENLIRHSAVTILTDEDCGGIPGDTFPNNVVGWGRIDAYAGLGVMLTPDYSRQAFPGMQFKLEHTITNSRREADTFDLTLTSSQGWASIEASEMDLEAGESAIVLVKVSVPLEAEWGLPEVATLTAASQSNSIYSASSVDTISVSGGVFLPMLLYEP